MSKRKTPPATTSPASRSPQRTGASGHGSPPWFSRAALREIVESVAIALILAFMVRTFEAEAFVIPTGSMAPTLMGRHKDVVCPECGYPYQVSASEEVDPRTNELNGVQVTAGTCPMCRYQANLAANNPQGKSYPSFSGDRILVGKFFYQFQDPRRWDVAVFRYPGDAKINYIKRIVGLPNETIILRDGDVFARAADGTEQILRKSDTPKKLLKMLQPVYDNDYVDKRLIERGWPVRWQAEDPSAKGAWHSGEDYRALSSDGSASAASWVRYHHYPPAFEQWQDILHSQPLGPVRPQLIHDFYAYNASRQPGFFDEPRWVGDLAVGCTLHVEGNQGHVAFDLVKAGRHFGCTIDVGTGDGQLTAAGVAGPKFSTSIRGPGTFDLLFSNLDDELLLWRDRQIIGRLVYNRLDDLRPTEADRSPVGIAAQGVAVRAEHIRVTRDIYYRPQRDFDGQHLAPEFPLKSDEFLMLGDNSPCSSDSRMWGNSPAYPGGPPLNYYVKRDLLVGKALFIYWPHSWDQITIGGWNIPLPFFPNFRRMEAVH